MEKRTIIAIILMFIVMVLWGVIESKFFPKPPPQIPKQEEKKEQPAAVEKGIEKGAGLKEAKPQKAGSGPATIKMVEKKEVSVETNNFWAILTNEDGRVKHFRLKKYEDRAKQAPMTIKLLELVHGIIGGKVEEPPNPKPMDLVNTEEGEGLPLGVTFSDSNLAESEGYWEVDKESLKLLNSGEKGDITFVKAFEGGVKVYKRYEFSAEEEAVNLQVEIQNESSKEVTTQIGLEWIGRVELKKLAAEGNKDFGLKYVFFKNHKAEVKDLAGAGGSGCTPGCQSAKTSVEPFEFSDKGDIGWYAFEGEYFAAMLFPPPSEKNVILAVKGNEKNLVRAAIMTSAVSIPSQQSAKMPFKVYMGPRSEDQLKKLGSSAEKIIDFGYFTIVAKPILWFLNLTHKATNNYGLDIILVSILMKLIFLPLTQISFKSMKNMQKIQPEMNRLRETYKDDKARLQQEIMLLYKRRKVNPMSGCLPMVIQIPVFIALYNALQNAIEMRHAPFFLWITDLAAKDPLYISPIVMGASMVIQQKMTPTAGDPAQAKLMLLMPVMFTFLFLSFPSGLVIYWMVNNVLSIAHQYYLSKS